MRNTLKNNEKYPNFEPKCGINYEKCLFEKVFLIVHLFD